jgi:hypothetical protein
MENLSNDYKNIPGWGMDADPKNEPTYPMKNWTGDDHNRIHWERPEQQPQTVEILHSNERPSVSAVFGATHPPSGLSGMIRRMAFKFSESEHGHWLPLLIADRVNMVEGIVDDLAHGHVPNIFAEKGWKAEWKYNKVGLITKLLTATAVTYVAVSMMKGKSKKKKKMLKRG